MIHLALLALIQLIVRVVTLTSIKLLILLKEVISVFAFMDIMRLPQEFANLAIILAKDVKLDHTNVQNVGILLLGYSHRRLNVSVQTIILIMELIKLV